MTLSCCKKKYSRIVSLHVGSPMNVGAERTPTTKSTPFGQENIGISWLLPWVDHYKADAPSVSCPSSYQLQRNLMNQTQHLQPSKFLLPGEPKNLSYTAQKDRVGCVHSAVQDHSIQVWSLAQAQKRNYAKGTMEACLTRVVCTGFSFLSVEFGLVASYICYTVQLGNPKHVPDNLVLPGIMGLEEQDEPCGKI